jgi:hypothetical protein
MPDLNLMKQAKLGIDSEQRVDIRAVTAAHSQVAQTF